MADLFDAPESPRLPLAEAERLVASIRAKGARLAVPGVVDGA